MMSSTSAVKFWDGFGQEKISMWSGISYIFLKIHSVELDDAGLYFCGFYEGGRPTFGVIHLKIEGKMFFIGVLLVHFCYWNALLWLNVLSDVVK